MIESKEKPPVIFEKLFSLIGKLNYSFTNTESLLIHLIAGLAKTDKETSSVIFLTLNTTRARMSLVERLSKNKKVDEHLRSEVLDITKEIARILKIKNKYNHCIYSFDNDAGQASTILMKIFDKKDEIKLGKLGHIDDKELDKLQQIIDDVEKLNRNIWRFLTKHKFPV